MEFALQIINSCLHQICDGSINGWIYGILAYLVVSYTGGFFWARSKAKKYGYNEDVITSQVMAPAMPMIIIPLLVFFVMGTPLIWIFDKKPKILKRIYGYK